MTRHNVFISYHHENDEGYKNQFVDMYGHLFIDHSVYPGEYDDDLSDEYIKRLIREEKITDSTVIVVLVGEDTYNRKHVDWEIYAGLTDLAGGHSGLLGIIVPPIGGPRVIPARLGDNIQTGYAQCCYWPLIQTDVDIELLIDEAFERKNTMANKINNHRLQMQGNVGTREYVVNPPRFRL